MLYDIWWFIKRRREEKREKKYALAEIRANGWRSPIVTRAEAARYATSWKRAIR